MNYIIWRKSPFISKITIFFFLRKSSLYNYLFKYILFSIISVGTSTSSIDSNLCKAKCARRVIRLRDRRARIKFNGSTRLELDKREITNAFRVNDATLRYYPQIGRRSDPIASLHQTSVKKFVDVRWNCSLIVGDAMPDQQYCVLPIVDDFRFTTHLYYNNVISSVCSGIDCRITRIVASTQISDLGSLSKSHFWSWCRPRDCDYIPSRGSCFDLARELIASGFGFA